MFVLSFTRFFVLVWDQMVLHVLSILFTVIILLIILLQNFSAQLEKEILASGNKL